MKKLTYILSAVLSLVLLFSHLNPALADSTPSTSLGTTSFYTTQTEQEQEVKVYRDLLKYNIATPLQIPANSIPATKEEFDTKYVPNIVKALGDGSVTKAWFDFQGVDSPTAGKQLFTVNAPLGQKIYSVVAGKPLQQCPLEIQDTQISFFLDQNKATQKAEELDKKGYFIYVSPSEELRKKVLDNLYDQYSVGKNPACFLVNGETKKASVDFKEIFNLLPPNLQQPAKQSPFVFTPKNPNDFLYVVNARKTS